MKGIESEPLPAGEEAKLIEGLTNATSKGLADLNHLHDAFRDSIERLVSKEGGEVEPIGKGQADTGVAIVSGIASGLAPVIKALKDCPSAGHIE